MPQQPPILIIQGDREEQLILLDVIGKLNIKNPVKFIDDGVAAFEFLQNQFIQPLVILCDVNIPGMNGLELRRKINAQEALRRNSIPFLFLTSSANKQLVREAYDLTVQGFFLKPKKTESLENVLKVIIDYWKSSVHPNSF
jgi:CheY-like chemotaxis protein